MPDANPKYKKVPRPESVEKLIQIIQSRNIPVTQIDKQHLIIYRDRKSDLLVHMTNIYIFGLADFEETLTVKAGISVVVSMSGWNGYTNEAKEFGKSKGVGLFKFAEFLGAINFDEKKFIDYEPPDPFSR